MMESLLKRIERNKKEHTRLIALILCLSIVVSLGVFNGFRKNAVAKTYTKTVLDCPYAADGAEPVAHTHSTDCFDENRNLICTLPELEAHEHSDACWSESTTLVCDLEENPGHVHTEECYTAETSLVCNLEESEGHQHSEDCYILERGDLICENTDENHQHTDECYTWNEVLSCGMEAGEGAHVHSDDCYQTEQVLTCGMEAGEGAHTHTDDCYQTEKILTCGKEELPVHVHDENCFREEEITVEDEPEAPVVPEMPVGDPNADLETAEDWERDFDDLELSGNWAADLITVAATQEGNGESGLNFIATLNDAGDAWVTDGYTRYGAWYGTPYSEWSALFVSFCLRYAGIPTENVPNNPTAALMAESFSKGNLFAGADYTPAAGDLIFFDTDEEEGIDHMGIVCSVDTEENTVSTIEGDRTDEVAAFDYAMDDEEIVGYGILPQNPDYVPTEENNNNTDETDGLTVMTEESTNTEKTAEVTELTADGLTVKALDGTALPEDAAPSIAVVEDKEAVWNQLQDLLLQQTQRSTLKKAPRMLMNAAPAASSTGSISDYAVFDIGLGTEETLDGMVQVTVDGLNIDTLANVPENAIVTRVNYTLYHIHDDAVSTPAVEVTEENGIVTAFTFETDNFSKFVLSYTVDFEYVINGRTYQFNMNGGESVLLSDLAEILSLLDGTDYPSVNDFIANIQSVCFSDESLVRVTQIEGDWLLESLQAFNTEEELSITMSNGDVITVYVTDAQYTDITSLMSSVSINGATKNADGSYNVFPGTPYFIDLIFEETPEDKFNKSSSLTYKLPDGVKIPEATSGTLVPEDSSQAEIYSINYTIATDGTITFTWEIKPGKQQDFEALPGLFIKLKIEAEFDENKTEIDWHGKAQVTVDQTHDVGVNKSANLGQDGYMYYTVTVTSTGDNKNISLTDTISGTALTLDQSSITETTNHGATFTNKSDKGFDISIPELKHGESATISYRAKVDYDVLASEAGVEKGKYGSVTTTGNQISINGPDDNSDNNTSETHSDHNISFSGVGKSVQEGHYNEGTGKRTMNWQIKANEEHRTTISYIHDEMGEGSNKMNYSGEGITVKVVNPDWSVADTYTVPWSQLGVNANSTEWTYNIPEQYKDKNYSFVIDYTTDVDVSDSIVPVTVKNDADTDYGEGGTGGKADPAPGSKLDMEKSVVETDIPGGTVTWSITVDVPATGLDSCVVTDTLPSVTGPKSFTDGFDSSSFSAARDVAGLIDGETVSLDTTQSGKVIFTFYKDGQPGLYPVEGGRKVTITLTTTLDEDWMAYEITQDYLRYYNTHTNNAKVVANNYTVEDSASVTVNSTDPDMIKKADSYMSDNFHWQQYGAENNLKAWMYRLYLYGISDDTFTDGYLEITDTFDDRYLAYYDPDNTDVFTNNGNIQLFHQKLTHGSENGNYNDPVDIEATVSGGTITFRIPKSAFLNEAGGYDRFYHVSYFLHVKDKDTIQKMDEDALAAGGTLKIKNTAVWAYSEPTDVEVEHKIPIIKKDYTVKNADAGVYDFVIKVNEGGNQLGDADYLEVTDSYTNLTIDYATLTCEPEDALLSYTHSGNTVTYFVKNGVPVTLRYTASALESGAFSNTVEVNNQSVTKTGTANITSRGSTGAREASIKILKHSGSNLLEGIENVQFELYEYDENYPNNYNPEAKVLSGTYSTNANGMFTIQHIPLAVEDGSYTTHTKKYVLHEVEPPEGYKALPHDYVFTVDTQTASYGQYIYLHDDTLPISNEPVKEENISITVNKIWPDGDADLPELIRVRLYQKDSKTASAASATEVEMVEMTRGTDGSWTHTFTGLDSEKAYFIKEDPIEGYTASYSSNNILGLEQSGTITITNTKNEPDDETTSITVKKKWMQGEEEITDIEQKKDLSATVELVRYRAEQSMTKLHVIRYGDSNSVDWQYEDAVPISTDVALTITCAKAYQGVITDSFYEWAYDISGSTNISANAGDEPKTYHIDTSSGNDVYLCFRYPNGVVLTREDISIDAISEGTSVGAGGELELDQSFTGTTIELNRGNGWRASFSNLPTTETVSGKTYDYTYGIRETEPSDSSFAFESYSVGTYNGEGSNNATVAVASGSTVTVTNKKEAPQTGKIIVKKTFKGVTGDDLTALQNALTITITGKDVGGTNNNTLVLYWSDVQGEGKTIDNLPLNEKYQITESITGDNATAVLAKYEQVTSGTDASVTSFTDVEPTVDGVTKELVNSYEKKTGALKVHKEVTYNGHAPTNDTQKSVLAGTYTFTIFTNEACTTPYQEVAGTNKTVSVTIGNDGVAKDSETVTLPVGTYWIREENPTQEGVTPDENEIPVSVTMDCTTEVPAIASFTNNKVENKNPDELAIDLEKTFTGLPTSKIPANFHPVLSYYPTANATERTTLTLGATQGNVTCTISDDLTTWHWHVTHIPTAAHGFQLSEENFAVAGYNRTTVFNGDTEHPIADPSQPQNVTVLVPKVTLEEVTSTADYTTPDNSKAFTLAENQILLVRMTSNATVIVSQKSLSIATRTAIENYLDKNGWTIVDDNSPNAQWKKPAVYFSKEVHGSSFAYGGRTIYFDENNVVRIPHKSSSHEVRADVVFSEDSDGKNCFTLENSYEEVPISLEIIKTEKDSSPVKYLPGADFTITRLIEEDGSIEMLPGTTTHAFEQTQTTSDEEETRGKLTFNGLTTGIYEIKETKTPSGYVIDSDMTIYIRVEDGVLTWLEKTKDGSTVTWTKKETSANGITFTNAVADNPETAANEAANAFFTVPNTPGTSLPNTGGPGTRPYTVLGSILILGAGVLLWRRRRLI